MTDIVEQLRNLIGLQPFFDPTLKKAADEIEKMAGEHDGYEITIKELRARVAELEGMLANQETLTLDVNILPTTTSGWWWGK